MKSLILVSVFISVFSFISAAQEKEGGYIAKPRLSVGLELAVPSNDGFGGIFSIGFGGSGKFEVPLTNKIYATATAGLTAFYLKKEFENMTYNKNYVPLKGGLKYYLKQKFYAEGEVGASIGTNKGAGTAFLWSPGVGISYPITKDGYFDTGIRYEKWARDGGNISQFGIRIAYKF